MNSIIISSIVGFAKGFRRAYESSTVYRAVERIYMAFSESWKKSAIIGRIKGSKGVDCENYSMLYKILFFPFAILEKLSESAKDFFVSAYDNSFALKNAFSFLENALSLNTRFYALIIISAAVFRQVAAMSFSYKLTGLIAIGILLFLADYNITDFLKSSLIVKFCLSLTGFSDISFDFYDKKEVKTRGALVLAVIVGAISGALSTKSLLFGILPFAAIVGGTLILKYPVSGIFFSVFAAPFVPTMVLAALVLYTAFSVMFEAVRADAFNWRIDGIGIGLGVFLIFMLISSIFSFSAKKSILVWGMYFIFIGYYYVIINSLKTKETILALIKIFVIAGFFVSIYGCVQYIFGWNTSNAWIDETMFSGATMRAYSTMDNPNVLGEYLLFVIPFSVFLMLRSDTDKKEQWFWFAVVCVSTLCMIFTQSRGCWIGLFIAAAIFVSFYNGRIWGFLPFLLLVIPLFIPQTMVDRLMSVGNMGDTSTRYRVFIWRGTIDMLRDFWIGGIGMGEGAFSIIYPHYSYHLIYAPHSHNLYLQLLVEGGICAFLIFAATVAIYLRKISMLFSVEGKSSNEGLFAICCVSAMIGFLIQSLFDYTFYNYRMMAMFFMIIAISVSLVNIEEANDA